MKKLKKLLIVLKEDDIKKGFIIIIIQITVVIVIVIQIINILFLFVLIYLILFISPSYNDFSNKSKARELTHSNTRLISRLSFFSINSFLIL